ncbi:MAG: tyrosine-type recombinase/integrase [Candidatus Eremiobacteraeota bacterium]|nr:tyrosine-type recombinase/integrase [Candidatus Eremiobacteraeota bacterium]
MKKRGPVYEKPEFLSLDPEIAGFAERYLAIRGTTPRTREAYQRDLEHFGAFLKSQALGTDPDEKLPPPYDALTGAKYADILAYQTHLARSRRYAPRSVRRKIATLRTFYKHLRHSGRRDDNPAADAILPKIGRPLPKAMRGDEVARVFAVAPPAGLSRLQRARDQAILQCLWSCGVRRAELVGLDLNDVDLDGRSLRVIKGKGNKDRYVPMTPEAAAALGEYLALRPRVSVPAFFVGRGDRRLSAAAVYKIVRAYMQLAGITEHASPHTWRHTVATLMRERGADLLFLKEFLGHESTATTEIYTKLARGRLRAEFDEFHPREDV